MLLYYIMVQFPLMSWLTWEAVLGTRATQVLELGINAGHTKDAELGFREVELPLCVFLIEGRQLHWNCTDVVCGGGDKRRP